MQTNLTFRRFGVMATMVVAFVAAAHAEDQAVVVGINQYEFKGANLKGCVADAEDMAGTLTRFKFSVTKLLDAQATKDGILGAIRAASNRSKPNDRFVFYFAGHGTNWDDATTVILPHDFRVFRPEEKDLSHRELNQSIVAVPAKSHTVILDSCHSEGMMRGAKGFRGNSSMQSRYFNRRDGAKDLVEVNKTDDIPTASGVCYVVACRRTETACELDINGQRRGVFTYSLTRSLAGASQQWGTVQVNVAKSVGDLTEELQHPNLTPSYRDHIAFDAGSSPPPPAPDHKSLWDLYSEDRADPERVKLTMEPAYANGIVPIDREFAFRTQIGQTGYLIILERGTSGSVNLIFPLSLEVESARVEASKTINSPIDPTKAYIAKEEGTERIKAIFFTNREEAASVLQKFPKSRSIKNWSNLRDMEMVNRRAQFWTSTLSFEATNRK